MIRIIQVRRKEFIICSDQSKYYVKISDYERASLKIVKKSSWWETSHIPNYHPSLEELIKIGRALDWDRMQYDIGNELGRVLGKLLTKLYQEPIIVDGDN